MSSRSLGSAKYGTAGTCKCASNTCAIISPALSLTTHLLLSLLLHLLTVQRCKLDSQSGDRSRQQALSHSLPDRGSLFDRKHIHGSEAGCDRTRQQRMLACIDFIFVSVFPPLPVPICVHNHANVCRTAPATACARRLGQRSWNGYQCPRTRTTPTSPSDPSSTISSL